jgi:3-hydroxybutyryl-CoA dehydrogenase
MKINVLGSGYMGKQICSLFVVLGHSVNLWQNTNEKLDNILKAEIQKLNKYFDLDNNGTFSVVNDISNLGENLTIETLKEDLKVKKEIISKLKFKNNIFSNTSSLKLSEIGENINGFHFMNPITVPLIELCKRKQYSDILLNELIMSLKNCSYEVINVTDKPGFLVNRILFKEISYFFYLYEIEKKTITDLKKIYKVLLKNSDPIKIVNMIGIDTSLSILENLKKYDKNIYVPNVLKESVKNSVLGFKNKKLLKL